MVEIQSKESIDKISEELKVQPSLQIPRKIKEDIQLTYDIGDDSLKRSNVFSEIERGTSGNQTLFTTPTDRDFYITSLTLSYGKNALCSISSSAISILVDIDGISRRLLSMSVVTLEKQNGQITIAYPYPFKVDRGENILVSGSFGAGILERSAAITGFTIDPQ